MRILLLGSTGMLGQAIYGQLSESGHEIITAARTDADYCIDLTDGQKVESLMKKYQPGVVINAAGVVDFGFCAENPGEAYLINGRLPGLLSEICREVNCYLVHVSTDQYYLGDGKLQHNELFPVKIENEYSRSKYIGEQLVLLNSDALILRTNIVGFRGRGKPTFLEWAINEIEHEHEMNLFTDYFTSSIHTNDFARILTDILAIRPAGVYNLASSEVNSKKDFIVSLSKTLFGKSPHYRDASVRQLQGPPRADSLGLDTSKIEELLGYKMPDLKETMESIKKDYCRRRGTDAL